MDELLFKKHENTYLEELRVHKKEIYMANALAYFFKTKKGHDFGKYFFNALVECYDKNDDSLKLNANVEIKKVTVEDKTEKNSKGKRIDFIIITNKNVLCIEFKINHELNNDLGKYKMYVEDEDKYKDKKHVFIVLTPNIKKSVGKAKSFYDNKPTNCIEFKQVTFRQFIKKLEENPPSLPNDGLPKFMYLDFIQTLKNRSIRYTIYKELEKLEKKLDGFVFHKNNLFLEKELNDKALKIRFNSQGLNFEKWESNKKLASTIWNVEKCRELNDKIYDEIQKHVNSI
jgi:hypothetical protein